MIPHELNPTRIAWDLRRLGDDRYEAYWRQRQTRFLPPVIFTQSKPLWLEIGAGAGWFFVEMAKRHADTQFVAIERSRDRGSRLVRKAERSGLTNIIGVRGNAIPTLVNEIPNESVERIYILYPPPWPRNTQRKNRWHMHPVMPHFVRILKKDGLLIWASDQEFYLNEAKHVSESRFALETLVYGPLSTNPYNSLDLFPEGRTKFERTFRADGMTCYELISRKTFRGTLSAD